MKWVFFGSSAFSAYVLDTLKANNTVPDLIVTTPDKPKGRKLILTPNDAKSWAIKNQVKFVEFKSLKDPTKNVDGIDAIEFLKKEEYDLFLVASYGRIIPNGIFEIPKHKTLNIHPSLLPRWRGASPIVSQILNNDKEVGVSIMVIDEGMDTGPVILQKKIEMKEWPVGREFLEKEFAKIGAEMFLEIYPKWINGEIEATPQTETGMTLCGKITKEDGELNLNDDPLKNLLKVKAYEGWPTAYFFVEKDNRRIRIIVKDATIEDGNFKILRVIPEGKKEMSYEDFLRGNRTGL